MKVKEPDALEVFHQCDSIKKGHFIINPGNLHTTVSINVYAVLAYVTKAHHLCYGIAERFVYKDPEVVIGLGGSGAILAPWTAQNITLLTGRKVVGISAEKVSDDLAGKRVLVVEGILTTGDTAREVITAVQKIGGNTVGLGALWNRGGVRAQDVDVLLQINALVNTKLHAWTRAQCVHCELGIPITQG